MNHVWNLSVSMCIVFQATILLAAVRTLPFRGHPCSYFRFVFQELSHVRAYLLGNRQKRLRLRCGTESSGALA